MGRDHYELDIHDARAYRIHIIYDVHDIMPSIARTLLRSIWVSAGWVALTTPASVHAQTLTLESARSIVSPFYAALNAGSDATALLTQVTRPDWVSCGGNDDCRPRAQVIANIAGFPRLVPDLKWEIKELLVSGERVIVRGEASGTPSGTFMGAPHAGRAFRIMTLDIHTIEGGLISRSFHVEDWLGATRQLNGR